MTPLTLPSQVTLESRVTIDGSVPVWTYCDYWGTYVSVFDLSEPHSELVIRGPSTVETEPVVPPPAGVPTWAELSERRRGAAA
jgi:transglutaminase-like putative cysteine protease